MAAVLDLGPAAVVSHRAAAALHGFDGFERRPVEVTLPAQDEGFAKHGPCTRPVASTPSTGCGSMQLPATSASRTIIDLAATASVAELERAIDSAVRDGLTSPAFLAAPAPDPSHRGRRGVVLLDELLADSGGHSDLERRFLALVRSAGLPRPICQRVFAGTARRSRESTSASSLVR